MDLIWKLNLFDVQCSLFEREIPAITYNSGGTYTLGALLEVGSSSQSESSKNRAFWYISNFTELFYFLLSQFSRFLKMIRYFRSVSQCTSFDVSHDYIREYYFSTLLQCVLNIEVEIVEISKKYKHPGLSNPHRTRIFWKKIIIKNKNKNKNKNRRNLLFIETVSVNYTLYRRRMCSGFLEIPLKRRFFLSPMDTLTAAIQGKLNTNLLIWLLRLWMIRPGVLQCYAIIIE